VQQHCEDKAAVVSLQHRQHLGIGIYFIGTTNTTSTNNNTQHLVKYDRLLTYCSHNTACVTIIENLQAALVLLHLKRGVDTMLSVLAQTIA
jgi:hypothetical protein